MKNLGILLSGRGSNFEAIAKNVAAGRIPNARIAVVCALLSLMIPRIAMLVADWKPPGGVGMTTPGTMVAMSWKDSM